MKQQTNLFILTLGVFSIINTEMGIIGILPMIANHFSVTISTAGLLVSLFALAIAVSGPTMPLLFSGVDRKKAMLLVQGMFLISTIISAFATSFTIILIARVLPAFFHPIYCSLALSVAASSVSKADAPRAVSKVLIGVSAGMVLGVPIVSFIADAVSLQAAMFSFIIVSALAFLTTLFFIPSMPVKERLSYGSQLSILKEPIVWISIASVIFLNGAVFGVYSFFAEYLTVIPKIAPKTISLILLIYGLANILGNIIAGKVLSRNPVGFAMIFPFALGAVYLALFFLGELTLPIFFITLFWGILGGAAANINQYLITSAAPKTLDFANGLFLSSTNFGTSFSTMICGIFITGMGTQFFAVGGIMFLIFCAVAILMRVMLTVKNRYATTELK